MCKSRGIYRNTLPSKSLDLVVESSNVYYFTEGFSTSKPTTRTEDNLMSLGGSTVNAKVLVKRDGGAPSGAPYSAKVCGTSSCRRIPCKARGVSSKHVPENAYFDIPVNAPHGLLLSCSNIECARSIRKFRYCRVCASPVSKRNFVSRHGHGVIHSAKEVKTEVDEVYGSVVDASNLITGSPSSFDGSDGPVLRTLDDLVNTRNDVNHMALQQRVVSVEQLNNLEKHNQKQQGICGTYRRIPCRARCMPKNHTPDTAYIEIPLDAKHGMLLSCSMKSCRDQLGGPRFRYCQVCEQPVAKRNFSKRHSHGILYLARRWGDRTDRLLSCQVISDSCAPELNKNPISSEHSVHQNSENVTNNHNQQQPLLMLAETLDSTSQCRTNLNQQGSQLQGVRPQRPLSEVSTPYLLPWVPPPDQGSRVLTTEWLSTVAATSFPPSPRDLLGKHLSSQQQQRRQHQQQPEYMFRCATPSPPSMELAGQALVLSCPLYPKVTPPWVESSGSGTIIPEQFDGAAFMEDGIDFSAIFDHDGSDDEEFESSTCIQ